MYAFLAISTIGALFGTGRLLRTAHYRFKYRQALREIQSRGNR